MGNVKLDVHDCASELSIVDYNSKSQYPHKHPALPSPDRPPKSVLREEENNALLPNK